MFFQNRWKRNNLDANWFCRPAPNNPVGVAWIGLDKPGYGIHERGAGAGRAHGNRTVVSGWRTGTRNT